MTERYTGSGRLKEGGFLAVHKQDLNAHVSGGDLRHDATMTDMNPIIQSLGGATVQSAIENLVSQSASSGTGFISVGSIETDGYAVGTYNVGASGVPTLREALILAFADQRLTNGGVVLILAGTYKLSNTVDVPAGITIIGEVAGTVIVGEMIEQSMFKVLRGGDKPKIGGDSGLGEISLQEGSPIDETRFVNLILADNLDGYVQSVGVPISTMRTVPMIDAERSSRLFCEGVKFIGRINNGVVAGRFKTQSAIGGYTTGGSTASHLHIDRCYFDGLGVAVNFTPSNGDIDHLTINKCRARVFGREDAGDLGFDVNCFVNMSLCNLSATQNYFVADAGFINTCFVVSAVGGGTDVSVLISGTTGGSLTTTGKGIFENTTSTAVKAVVNNSNWNSNVGPGNWFVTVGGAGGVLDEYGDFNGDGAIDLLLSASYNYPSTVYVNGEGPYTITNVGKTRYNFVGNRDIGKRPIFNMNLGVGAPTDEVGNKYFTVGSRIENIQFRSSTATTTDFHSIRPAAFRKLVAKDCDFDNTTLSISEVVNKDVQIVNCFFNQDNTYSDNINLMVPSPDNESTLLIENCVFRGVGYAGLIGLDTAIGYDGGASDGGSIILRNCIFDKSSDTIDDASPLTIESYLVIDAPATKLSIDSCQMIVDGSLTVRTTVINAARSSTYLRHIYIQAKDINIENSLFQGPSQVFDVTAVNYPLPVVEIVPINNLNIDRSRFLDSVTQIGNSVASFESGKSNGITITSSEFANKASTIITQTLLDIDLDPTTTAKQSNSNPYILISGNNFHYEVAGTASSNAPFHTAVGSTSYAVHGVIQVYAKDFEVNVINNNILGTTRAFVTAASLAHSTGLVINNFDDTAGVDSSVIAAIFVKDNRIKVRNEYTTGSATNSASVLYLKGTDFIVSGNHLNIDNDATPSSSFIGVGVFDNRDTLGTNAPSPAMISGNVFSDKDDAGLATTLLVAWLRNESATEGNGYIIDNSFSSIAGVGAVAVFEDQGTGVSWVVDRNRNQTVAARIPGSAGNWALGLSSATVGVTGTGNTHINLINDIDQEVELEYLDTSTQNNFRWQIPLSETLPPYVRVISIALAQNVTSGTLPFTFNNIILDIQGSVTAVETSSTFAFTTPVSTHTFTPSGTFVNTPVEGLRVQIFSAINDPSGTTADYESLTITYRY